MTTRRLGCTLFTLFILLDLLGSLFLVATCGSEVEMNGMMKTLVDAYPKAYPVLLAAIKVLEALAFVLAVDVAEERWRGGGVVAWALVGVTGVIAVQVVIGVALAIFKLCGILPLPISSGP